MGLIKVKKSEEFNKKLSDTILSLSIGNSKKYQRLCSVDDYFRELEGFYWFNGLHHPTFFLPYRVFGIETPGTDELFNLREYVLSDNGSIEFRIQDQGPLFDRRITRRVLDESAVYPKYSLRSYLAQPQEGVIKLDKKDCKESAELCLEDIKYEPTTDFILRR